METLYQSSSVLRLAVNVAGQASDADIIDAVHQVYITITRVSDGAYIVNHSGVNHEGTGLYSYILDPNDNLVLGKYKVNWEYTIDGEVFPRTQYYDVVVAYTNASDCKAEYPELSDKSDSEIYRKEKLARLIINTFCKQKFDFEIAATKKIEGNDSDRLSLPRRMYDLDLILVENTDDITSQIELYNDYLLKTIISFDDNDEDDNLFSINTFKKGTFYYVTGSWGWEFVPENIQRATNLLIRDYFQDDSLLRQHGVFQATIGDEQYYFNNDLWNTTGNYDVDILIADYSDFNIRIF